MPDVSDHSHHLSPRPVPSAAHTLADGTFSGPGQTGDLFIHHHDQWSVRRVLFCKRPSLQHRDAHRPEVIRRSGRFVGGLEDTGFRVGSLKLNGRHSREFCKWKPVAHARGLDSRQRSYLFQYALVNRHYVVVPAIFIARNRQFEAQHSLRTETGIHILERSKTSDQQSGAGEQDDG